MIIHSRDFLFESIHEGTERWKSSKLLMHFGLLQFFINRFAQNYKLDSGEMCYTYDEINALREKKINLFDLLFENGDLGFYHADCASTHIFVAMYYAKKKEYTTMYAHLRAAAKQTLALLNYIKTENYTHSSLLFRDIEINGKESS